MIRLSDEQWERIRKHFSEEHIADDRPGRKPVPTRHAAARAVIPPLLARASARALLTGALQLAK
jgi:hypothetical protein